MSTLDSHFSRFHLRMSLAFVGVYIAAAWLATIADDQGNGWGVGIALILALVAILRCSHHLGLLRDHSELDLAELDE